MKKEFRVGRFLDVRHEPGGATMVWTLESPTGPVRLLLPIENAKAWDVFAEGGSRDAAQAAAAPLSIPAEFPNIVDPDALVLEARHAEHGLVHIFVERDSTGLMMTIQTVPSPTKH